MVGSVELLVVVVAVVVVVVVVGCIKNDWIIDVSSTSIGQFVLLSA